MRISSTACDLVKCDRSKAGFTLIPVRVCVCVQVCLHGIARVAR